MITALVLYVAAFWMTWIDKTFIQLPNARTLLEGGAWGFSAGYPANTATFPLNVLLTAAAGFRLGSVERTVPMLRALELAGPRWLQLRLFRHATS